MADEVKKLKDDGNVAFKKGEFSKALQMYSKALRKNSDDEVAAVLYSNRSACLIALGRSIKALEDAEKCCQLRPTWVKGFFRKATALLELERLDSAAEVLQEASTLAPGNESIIRMMNNVINKKVQRGEVPQYVGSSEDYEKSSSSISKGEVGEFSSEQIVSFAKEKIQASSFTVSATGEHSPLVHFMIGYLDEEKKEQVGVVGIEKGFESPAMHTGCVDFLRKYAVDTKAAAAVVVVEKRSIAYPQVWLNARKKDWPWRKNGEGMFVQLEAKNGMRRVWYIDCRVSDGKKIPQGEVELNVGDFAIIPPLFS